LFAAGAVAYVRIALDLMLRKPNTQPITTELPATVLTEPEVV
jgi:hypothetical protein